MSKKFFTKEQEKSIENFLAETGFEIWNAGATHRLQSDYSTDGFEIKDYSLHHVKDYKTLNGALSFMQKQDEQ